MSTYTVTLCDGGGEVEVQGAPRVGDRQGVSTGRLDFFGTVRSFTSGEGMDGRLSSGIVWETTDVLVASFAAGSWTHFTLNEEEPTVMDEVRRLVAKGGEGADGIVTIRPEPGSKDWKIKSLEDELLYAQVKIAALKDPGGPFDDMVNRRWSNLGERISAKLDEMTKDHD